MSRLIVISNRVSSPRPRSAQGSQGGLAVALTAALREYRGLWFGWSGETTEQFTGHINLQRNFGVTTATIDLEEQDVDEYYNGYANRTLWPLFHYRMDLAEFESGFAEGYERVNQRFAETLEPLLEADDLVWVHDYHLFPLGAELRAQLALRLVAHRLGDREIDALFDLARTNGVMPIVRDTARFNHHRQLIVSLFRHGPVRRLFFKQIVSRTVPAALQ